MSLHMLWGLLAAHPAKLINLLALLITCPGGLLLQSARRWEAKARQLAGDDTLARELPVHRFYYILGFASLAMALVLSWFSTWI
ncbi:MAG TPA: hypothetical protein VJS90_12830 [Pseudomonas sp.]|uniref:hypothetical protein n=1 Tax=Pseudomonas sp. TaxID=306 RepID=UPI002B4A9EA9|nr:hypothetical protein [Pseudomonas sp.]HKS13911.1 hypothetical protein [Pseudomonas sp.]